MRRRIIIGRALIMLATIAANGCSGAADRGRAPELAAPAAPTPCTVGGGIASATASDARGTAALQAIFVQPCDLSVRVSAIRIEVSLGSLRDVALVRISAPDRLAGPVTVYDATIDGAGRSTFAKEFVSPQPAGSLEEIHSAICSGGAKMELLFASASAPTLRGDVAPSNTGKC